MKKKGLTDNLSSPRALAQDHNAMNEYNQEKETLAAALGHDSDHDGHLNDHHAQDALAASIIGDGTKKPQCDRRSAFRFSRAFKKAFPARVSRESDGTTAGTINVTRQSLHRRWLLRPNLTPRCTTSLHVRDPKKQKHDTSTDCLSSHPSFSSSLPTSLHRHR